MTENLLGRTPNLLNDVIVWNTPYTVINMFPSLVAADDIFFFLGRGGVGRAYTPRMMSSRVKVWNLNWIQAGPSAALWKF